MTADTAYCVTFPLLLALACLWSPVAYAESEGKIPAPQDYAKPAPEEVLPPEQLPDYLKDIQNTQDTPAADAGVDMQYRFNPDFPRDYKEVHKNPLDVISNMVGVDRVKVKSGLGEEDTLPSVGVGKKFGDALYLEIERGIDPLSSKARMEMEVAPRLSLESATGAAGDSSVGVNWKHNY